MLTTYLSMFQKEKSSFMLSVQLLWTFEIVSTKSPQDF